MVYSQPWWHVSGTPQSEESDRLDVGGNNAEKERPTTVAPQSASVGNNGQEQQNVPSSISPTIGEHLDPNAQMELVGHSIMLKPFAYPDPHYGGIMTSYGPHMVYPNLYGIPQTRMPLPLEMEEEPVYVNAKQYHGILRRRQSRAKAELEKKVVKVRKPYLHESRHQHAMRRARGCGGRFLNTKKLDINNNNNASSATEKGTNSRTTLSTQSASSSGSDHLFVSCLNTSADQCKGKELVFQDIHSNGLSSKDGSPSEDSEADGDY